MKDLEAKKEKAKDYCDAISLKISSFSEEPNLDDRIDSVKKEIMELKTECRFKEADLKSISNVNENMDFCNHCNQKVSKSIWL